MLYFTNASLIIPCTMNGCSEQLRAYWGTVEGLGEQLRALRDS